MASKEISKQRRLADFLFVYFAYAIRYIYLLILIPFYGRVLGTEGYAVVLSAMSLMNVAWVFTAWGFSQAGVRAIATQNSSQYGKTFGAHFSARLILAVFAIVGSVITIYFSPILSGNLIAAYLALALGIVSAFNLGWYFSGSGRPRQAVSLEVIGFLISLGLILGMVKEPNDATYAILSLLISGLIVTAIAHFWIRKEISPSSLLQPSAGMLLIRSSGYLFFYSSSAMLVSGISTYILGLFSSVGAVGEYGAADRLVSLGISVMSPMGILLVPKITNLHANNPQAAYSLSKKVLGGLLFISISGTFISTVFAPQTIALIFGDGFAAATPILRIFSIIFPINALIIFIGSYILIPLHQEKALAKSVILGILVCLITSAPLSRSFHGMGMATARVLSDFCVLLALTFFCMRNDKVLAFLKASHHR